MTRREVILGGAALCGLMAVAKPVKDVLAVRQNVNQSVSKEQEDAMYKEILEAMIRNTSGASIDLSGIFPYDGPQFTWGTSGLLSNGQLFRYSKFEHIDVGNCMLINSYGFSSSTLKSVRCGSVGNNSTIFLQCPALTDVYIVKNNTTQALTRTAIFNATPNDQNKQITWHCKPDGKKITWNAETSKWDVTEDAS